MEIKNPGPSNNFEQLVSKVIHSNKHDHEKYLLWFNGSNYNILNHHHDDNGICVIVFVKVWNVHSCCGFVGQKQNLRLCSKPEGAEF